MAILKKFSSGKSNTINLNSLSLFCDEVHRSIILDFKNTQSIRSCKKRKYIPFATSHIKFSETAKDNLPTQSNTSCALQAAE